MVYNKKSGLLYGLFLEEIMNEKKRAKLLKIFRVLALILAVGMILGIFVQGILY